MLQRELYLQRALVIALSGVFLTGCETSKNRDPLQGLTDAEIDKLEQEIKQLPENSVIIKVFSQHLLN